MNRIGQLSSVVVWVLAMVVAWLERQADDEREASPERADAPAADSGAPTRTAERSAPPTTNVTAATREAAEAPRTEQPAPPEPAEQAEQDEQPEQPEQPERRPEQREPPAEPSRTQEQQTAATGDEPTTDEAPLPPTTAPPDVLAVAAGDLQAGAAERRHGRSVPGDGTRECPPDYPIKGNASSRIYHRPGDSSYAATIAEVCFVSAEDAEAEGFRPRKR